MDTLTDRLDQISLNKGETRKQLFYRLFESDSDNEMGDSESDNEMGDNEIDEGEMGDNEIGKNE